MEPTVYELARELANRILESDYAKAVNETRYIFDGNEQAQKLLFDYSDAKKKYELEKDSLTEEGQKERLDKISDMAQNLRENSVVADMMRAENRYRMFVSSVMDVFNASLSGQEQEGGCTGKCSTCAGCH
ncbi:MAG TPA: hypothetical protein DCG28_05125 [Lachnospiraceae bacterium]|nr:hypothetical protein [Lachnospiraceae bacterium]